MTPIKLRNFAARIAGHDDIMGQEHPQNNRVEFDLEQLVELLARSVPAKRANPALPRVPGAAGYGGVVSIWQQFGEWLAETLMPRARSTWFGKWRD